MKSTILTPTRRPAFSAGILSLIIAFTLSATSRLVAQTSYHVNAGSQITVAGTSNLHDWTMVAKSFTTEGTFTVKGTQLVDITALTLTIPVKNLNSKESLMDSRAYKTLKEEQFKNITFKLTETAVNASQKTIKASGNLSISGVTNAVVLQLSYVLSNGEITFKGAEAIKMSDFKIKAPSFMLGALKTGDALQIDILLKMKN
jgi:polyisoprenoid-binding protein YceI